MKKNLLFAAALLLTLASCSSDNDLSITPPTPLNQQEQVPVTFGTYIGRTANTRAGYAGVITDTELKDGKNGTKTKGFGVFAYYTKASDYSSSATPNFMYNQQVYYDTNWKYEPLKYWPNETANGTVDQNGASSTGGADKISFFAYAPYVSPNVATGEFSPAETSGITKLTANTTGGDPKVYYTIASDAAKTVDLLWAVAGTEAKTYTTANGTPETIPAGMPNLNLTKQTIGEKVNFLFKHALAKLTFSVQGIFDEVNPGSTDVDSHTKIVIEKVDITSTFPQKGILNLNNTSANAPLWEAETIPGTVSFNITNGDIATEVKYNSSTDTYAGQSSATGVKKDKVALMDANKFFTLIPDTKNLTIEITYHVFTEDANLSRGYSKVTNVITKTISGLTIAGGKAYDINLQLGMTSVKVAATVSGWDSGTDSAVDLPINVEGISVAGTGGTTAVNTTASAKVYNIELTGLTGNTTYT